MLDLENVSKSADFYALYANYNNTKLSTAVINLSTSV